MENTSTCIVAIPLVHYNECILNLDNPVVTVSVNGPHSSGKWVKILFESQLSKTVGTTLSLFNVILFVLYYVKYITDQNFINFQALARLNLLLTPAALSEAY